MQNILPVVLLISFFTLSSCATYKSGQTPDDMYFAESPVPDPYVAFNTTREDMERYREDRQIRMRINDRRFRTLNDPFCNDPSTLFFRNNHCYCLANGNFVNFIPRYPNTATPLFQPRLSTLRNFEMPEPTRAGKISSTPLPSNGSRIFRGASNQNQIRYSDSYNNSDNENNGSRFFNSSPSSNPSPSFRSSGSNRSGRRQ